MFSSILRIRKEPDSPAPGGADDTYDKYLERLIKLIPSEVIAFYLVGKGLLPPGKKSVWVGWTIVCFIAVIVVRASTTRAREDRSNVQWTAVIIASISFIIWIYSLGDVFTLYKNLHEPYIASLLVLTWTFFLPYIYKGD